MDKEQFIKLLDELIDNANVHNDKYSEKNGYISDKYYKGQIDVLEVLKENILKGYFDSK